VRVKEASKWFLAMLKNISGTPEGSKKSPVLKKNMVIVHFNYFWNFRVFSG
jgi:hypothetical protein